LTEGKCLKDLAREGGTSINTVRCQFRAVLDKTRTTRQAELLCLLCNAPAMAA